MAKASPDTVVLKGRGVRKEAAAVATISPGHLIEKVAAGVQVHSTASGGAQKAFALENELLGNGLDVDYAAAEQVIYEVLPAGAEVRALLAANAAAIVVGDQLESDGDGTVAIHVPPANLSAASPAYNSIVGYAVESVDNSAGGTVVGIKMEVA